MERKVILPLQQLPKAFGPFPFRTFLCGLLFLFRQPALRPSNGVQGLPQGVLGLLDPLEKALGLGFQLLGRIYHVLFCHTYTPPC